MLDQVTKIGGKNAHTPASWPREFQRPPPSDSGHARQRIDDRRQVCHPALMEERFCVLETKYAYQENEITQLSAVIFKQQQAIDRLEAQLKKISDQLRELGFPGDTAVSQRPPHY